MITKIKYSQEKLIEQISKGDQKAFAYLYDNYSKALFGVIYKIVTSQEDAEDVLQQAFVKIWNNFGTYNESKGRLYTWMLTISRNLALDLLRSKNEKNKNKIQSLDNFVYALKSNNTLDSENDYIGLNKILAVLNTEEQELINLAYFEGFTQDEMSKHLEMPLGSVKTKMRNALQKLRASVTNEINPFG